MQTWTLTKANGEITNVWVKFVRAVCIDETRWVECHRIGKVDGIEHGSHWYAAHECAPWDEVTCIG